MDTACRLQLTTQMTAPHAYAMYMVCIALVHVRHTHQAFPLITVVTEGTADSSNSSNSNNSNTANTDATTTTASSSTELTPKTSTTATTNTPEPITTGSTTSSSTTSYNTTATTVDYECEALLVAAGRKPNVTAIGLETAGIRYNETEGVIVSDTLQTTNRAVYAVGDCCTKYQFTHVSDFMARLVIRNALFFGNGRFRSVTHVNVT
jgi:cytoskeletal protein RodZ